MNLTQKEKILNLTSLFVSIILTASIISGLGRMIQGIKFFVGVQDGFPIALAIFSALALPSLFPKFPEYSIPAYIIMGFLFGIIAEIISKSLLIITLGLGSSFLCLAFVLTERYINQKKEANILKILSLNFLAGAIAGLISGAVFSLYINLILLGSMDIKNIILGSVYWALWGGLILLGTKLSILYFKQVIYLMLMPIFTGIIYGLITGTGMGFFGTVIETINYTNTNFYAESQVKTFTQSIALSFFRDGVFGFAFGFMFTVLTKPKPFQKLGRFWFIIPGGLTGFLSLKFIHNFLPFVLSPLSGAMLGTGIGLSLVLSEKEEIKQKRNTRSLIFSAGFGFLALIISAFIEGKFKSSFLYVLGFGILGAVYGTIIIFSKLISEYYLEQNA